MITWNKIKRFFRGVDIAMMRDEAPKGVKLDSFGEVQGLSWDILQRVKGAGLPIMPPPPYAAWTPKMIQEFTSWMDNPVEVDTVLQQKTAAFAKLSELLTGFTGLNNDPDLASRYLERLLAQPELSEVVQLLISEHEVASDDSHFVEDVIEAGNYRRAAQAITLLWYTGALFDTNGVPDFGEPVDKQYTDGLVWLAIQAHPMAYSTEGRGYWSKEPLPNGRFTGLGDTATGRPKPKSTGPTGPV